MSRDAIPGKVSTELDESRPRSQQPVAIVGMAVEFPGASDIHALWNVLEQGLNTVSQVPDTRFDVWAYNDIAANSGRTMKTRYGNFLNDPFVFDNAFFRISPREARSMDPQQRLLLETAYHALEDAGYVPKITPSFDPATFGSFIGAATNDYVQNLRKEVDVYYSTGTLPAFLSGKISYAFGFSGPSIVFDTACSSSIVAIQQACRSLNVGDCNAAIAGGVNVITSPDMYIGLDRGYFLSPSGQCKPWDASADGYCRSEGCGVFVLKRLSDALNDNDRILGLIRAVEVNQSGNAESITHPHVPTQIDLFRKVLSSASVEPHEVSVVEAHGTGTKVGDPAELEAIRAVLAKNRPADNPLHVTAIKANIGHAEAASGVASLAKLVLMFQHNIIPATISLKNLNPLIPSLEQDNVRIDTEAHSWRMTGKRLALLNNFGAAGSNAAILLEGPPKNLAEADPLMHKTFILGLSCKSEAALEKLRDAYIQHLSEGTHDTVSLANMSYTSTARRQLYRFCLSVSGNSTEQLINKLQDARIVQVDLKQEKTVFVFSGQGSQYLGMGGDLYRTVTKFREIVDTCHAKLLSWNLPGILHIIHPTENRQEPCHQSFQAATFVLEFALASLWASWGVQPDAVVGHSLGEFAALVLSGVLKLDDALRLVAERARLVKEKCESHVTGMLAVHMDSEQVASLLASDRKYGDLTISCFNSPTDCVIGGQVHSLDILEANLKQSGAACKRLDIPFAYHTEALSAIRDDLTAMTSKIEFSAPEIPVFSNLQGGIIDPGDASVFTADYIARQSVEPVIFQKCVPNFRRYSGFQSANLRWIEIGPHPTTIPMLRSSDQHQSHLYLSTLRKQLADKETIFRSLSQLYVTSANIHWSTVFDDLLPGSCIVPLPAYPFSKANRSFIPYQEDVSISHDTASIPSSRPNPPKYSTLGKCLRMPSTGNKRSAVFEVPVDGIAAFIDGHKVTGYSLCPASVYIEAAAAVAYTVDSKLNGGSQVAILSDMAFTSPLVRHNDIPIGLRIELAIDVAGSSSFQITSITISHSSANTHCRGTIRTRSISLLRDSLARHEPIIDRRVASILAHPKSEVLRGRTIYDIIFPRVVSYASAFQTIDSIRIHCNGIDSYAEMLLPGDSILGIFALHPVFVDTLIHMAGFVINLNVSGNHAFICDHIEKVEIIPSLIDLTARHGIYCTVDSLSDTSASCTVFAIALSRESGHRIIARIRGIRFRKLKIALLMKSLSLAPLKHSNHVQSFLLEPDTQDYELEDLPPPSVDTTLVEESASSYSARSSNLTSVIRSTVANVLEVPVNDLSDDVSLSLLGLDSLSSIEMSQALRSALNVRLPDGYFLGSKTLRDIVDVVERALRAVILTADMCMSSTEDDLWDLHDTASILHAKGVASTTKSILASVLGLDEISDQDELECLGLDSLATIEAHRELQRVVQSTLPITPFRNSRTVHDIQARLVAEISAAHKSIPAPTILSLLQTQEPILLQNGDPSAAPLFLIHDGSGLITSYARLTSLGRTVFGIPNPQFPSNVPWKSGLLKMALHYASKIIDMNCNSCLVGGWSIGGVIAFEVARHLRHAGKTVKGLILVDSPSPDTSTPLPDALIEAVICRRDSHSTPTKQIRAQVRSATRALVHYDHRHSLARDVAPPNTVMLRCMDGIDIQSYGDCSALSWFGHHDQSAVVDPWESVLGSVSVINIEGNHFTAFEPEHIRGTSIALKEAATLLEFRNIACSEF